MSDFNNGLSVSGGLTVDTVDINGGAVDGAVIGGSAPAAGTFTTLNATTLNATGTSTAVAGDTSAALATTAFVQREKESLPTLSRVQHYGTVVASCLHIPAVHDTDAGAWTDRCGHTSWEQETLCSGSWLELRATELTARYTIPNTPEGNNWGVYGAPTIVPDAGGYFQANGTAGDYLKIPDSATNSVLGDVEIVAHVAPASWIVLQYYLSQHVATTTSGFKLASATNGFLGLYWSAGGVARQALSTATVSFVGGAAGWIKATLDYDNGAGGCTAQFFTSTDGITWSQLGTDVVQAFVVIPHDSTAGVYIGSQSTAGTITGKIYYAEIKSGIGGTTLAKFDGSTITANNTNDYFQATSTSGSVTSGKFYKLNAGSGVTEVFRGNLRKYPKSGILWIAEARRVVGYDAATGAMFKVYDASLNGGVYDNSYNISSVAAIGGVLILGRTGSTNYAGLVGINFVSDRYLYGSAILSATTKPGTAYVIVNATVNSVAATTLLNAPTDPATGLPIQTTLVATAGGLSWIMDSGVVWDSNYTSSYVTCDINAKGMSVAGYGSAVDVFNTLPTADSKTRSMQFHASSIPAISGTIDTVCWDGDDILVATSTGLFRIQYNPATPAKSMVSQISSTFNSGYMVGDIRGAWLASKDVTSLVGTPLLGNNYFQTDTDADGVPDGWTESVANSTTISAAGVRVSANTSAYPRLQTDVSAFAGQTVTVWFNSKQSWTQVDGMFFQFLTAAQAAVGSRYNYGHTTSTSLTLSVTVPATAAYLAIYNNSNSVNASNYIEFLYLFAQVSSEADRSVKSFPLIPYGTLTRTPLGTSGDSLVAYGNFAA